MSNFVLQSININNFRSIKKQTFSLKEGLFAVVGKNNDNNTSSNNGAGKTSIISALFWALTGSSLNGETLADEVINLQTKKNCKVECVFQTDQGEMRVIRTRKDDELGNSLSLILNDQDLSCHKIADTQERINQIIKVPFDLLKSTIIMTSDMKSRFSDLTPQGRINVLESVRDYSLWAAVREESKLDINELNKEITANSGKIDQLSGSIITYKELLSKTISDKEKDIESLNTFNYQQEKVNIDSKINELVLQKKDVNATLLSLDSTPYKNIISELQSQKDNILLNNNNDSEIRNTYKLKLDNVEQDINTLNNNILNIKSEISTLEFKKNIANQELSTINDWFVNDTCPTCHQKLNRTENDIVINTKRKDELIQELNNINSNLEILQNNLSQLTNIDSVNLNNLKISINNELNIELAKDKEIQQSLVSDLVDKIKQQEDTILNVENKIRDNNNLLNQIDKSIAEYENKALILKTNYETLVEKVNNIDNQITEYSNKITELNNQSQALTEKNQQLNKEKQLFDYYYQQLGPRGSLRPWLLSKDINYLNVCIKKYAKRFFENIDIYLTKPTIENNSMDIIVDCGSGIIKPVSCLSGGERKRVDLCIQLGLYDLIKSTSLFDINFVCFDEIESALDGDGIRTLIDIIDERKEIIPTILWITNRSEVMECIPNRINVTKTNGFSEVSYE